MTSNFEDKDKKRGQFNSDVPSKGDLKIKHAFKEIEKDILADFDAQQVYEKISKEINSRACSSKLKGLVRFFKSLKIPAQIGWGIAILEFIIIVNTYWDHYWIFKTLGSSGHAASQSGTEVNLVFDQEAKEKQIRKLLNQINGQIIGGPTPEGLYIVKISSSQIRSKKVMQLLKHSKIVKFVKLRYSRGKGFYIHEKKENLHFPYG